MCLYEGPYGLYICMYCVYRYIYTCMYVYTYIYIYTKEIYGHIQMSIHSIDRTVPPAGPTFCPADAPSTVREEVDRALPPRPRERWPHPAANQPQSLRSQASRCAAL